MWRGRIKLGKKEKGVSGSCEHASASGWSNLIIIPPSSSLSGLSPTFDARNGSRCDVNARRTTDLDRKCIHMKGYVLIMYLKDVSVSQPPPPSTVLCVCCPHWHAPVPATTQKTRASNCGDPQMGDKGRGGREGRQMSTMFVCS